MSGQNADRNITDISMVQGLLQGGSTKSNLEKINNTSGNNSLNNTRKNSNSHQKYNSKLYDSYNNDDLSRSNNNSYYDYNTNIRFQNFYKDTSNSQMTDGSEKIKREKRKRKSSITPFAENNPMNVIESIKNIKDYSLYGNKKRFLKMFDILIAFLSLGSILLSIFDNELYIKKSKKFILKYTVEEEKINQDLINEVYNEIKSRTISAPENLIRGINECVSVACCVFLLLRYRLLIEINKIDKKLSEYDGLVSSGFLPSFIFDCVISLLVTPPGVNTLMTGKTGTTVYAYSLNSIFTCLSVIKLRLIVRVIYYLSKYNLKISKAICKSHKVIPNLQFLMKCELKSKPFLGLGGFVVICLFLMGILIRGFEFAALDINRGLNGNKGINDLANLWNCIWLVLISLTSVGYGNEYPRTDLGRAIIFFAISFGMLILGLTIGSISNGIEFTPVEKKAYLKLKKLLDPENYEHKASHVIKAVLLLRKSLLKSQLLTVKEGKKNSIKEKYLWIMKLRTEVILFKNDYHVCRTYSMPITDLLRTMERKLYDNLMSLTKHLDKINLVENDCKLIQKGQIDIQKRIKRLTKGQLEVSRYLLGLHNSAYKAKSIHILSPKKSLKRTTSSVKERNCTINKSPGKISKCTNKPAEPSKFLGLSPKMKGFKKGPAISKLNQMHSLKLDEAEKCSFNSFKLSERNPQPQQMNRQYGFVQSMSPKKRPNDLFPLAEGRSPGRRKLTTRNGSSLKNQFPKSIGSRFTPVVKVTNDENKEIKLKFS